MADGPPSETCVECGVAINDPEWSRNSGGLCADCLADNALPLTRIEPPSECTVAEPHDPHNVMIDGRPHLCLGVPAIADPPSESRFDWETLARGAAEPEWRPAIEPPSDSSSNRCPTCGVLLHSGMQPCRPVGPPSEFPGPLYELCVDPRCPVAYAYEQPPTDHYHFVGCPAGGPHVWTDDVAFMYSDRKSSCYIPPAERWHCDHCGAPRPMKWEPDW